MSANPGTAAPTGRNKPAQGKERSVAALGHASQNTSRPEPERSGDRTPTGGPAGVTEGNQRAKQGGELPKGWTHTTLGQLSGERGQSVEPARTPEKQFELYSVPSFPEKKPEVVSGKEVGSNKQLVQPRSVLLCKINPRINRAWVVGDFTSHTKIASTEWIVFPATEDVVPDFLCYFLQKNAVRDFLAHNASGVGGSLMRVKPSTLRDFPFGHPSATEQRRIVAEIEKQFTRLEAGVAALRRVQANLKRYRAAVLKAACEGKLVPTEAELTTKNAKSTKTKQASISASSAISAVKNPGYETGAALLARILTERRQNWQGRGQYKEPAAPDTRNVATVPEGWTWASVDQLADETMIGLDRGRAQQSTDPATGLPYIKMNNVTMDGRVHCDELVFVPATREEATRYAVQDGDILFNTRNSKELVGKVGLVRNPPAGAIYNNNLMRIRVPAGVSQAFLALQMCSHEFRQRMELVKKATTSVAAVYSKDLLPLAIALPPLAEQTRIVAEVERRLSDGWMTRTSA